MSYEFSDAKWWHDRAQRFGGLTAQRAGELYPGFFGREMPENSTDCGENLPHMAGGLRPWSWEMRDLPREIVPPKDSAAYRRDKASLATKGMGEAA